MPSRTNFIICALALLVILSSARVTAEERRGTPEFLKRKYQELNRRFFSNSLPPVRIKWADLTEYKRLGETYRENDGTFVLLVDKKTNLRDEDLQDTVFHEMCHVANWRKEDNPHGPAFRACMDGVRGKLLQDANIKAR